MFLALSAIFAQVLVGAYELMVFSLLPIAEANIVPMAHEKQHPKNAPIANCITPRNRAGIKPI